MASTFPSDEERTKFLAESIRYRLGALKAKGKGGIHIFRATWDDFQKKAHDRCIYSFFQDELAGFQHYRCCLLLGGRPASVMDFKKKPR